MKTSSEEREWQKEVPAMYEELVRIRADQELIVETRNRFLNGKATKEQMFLALNAAATNMVIFREVYEKQIRLVVGCQEITQKYEKNREDSPPARKARSNTASGGLYCNGDESRFISQTRREGCADMGTPKNNAHSQKEMKKLQDRIVNLEDLLPLTKRSSIEVEADTFNKHQLLAVLCLSFMALEEYQRMLVDIIAEAQKEQQRTPAKVYLLQNFPSNKRRTRVLQKLPLGDFF